MAFVKRCVYLIEIYCVLQTLNGNEVKEYEEFEEIANPTMHIKEHMHFLIKWPNYL